jgi:uncharacterized protein (TIGR02246 family)
MRVGVLVLCLAGLGAACASEPGPSPDLVSAQQVQALGMKIWDAFSRLDVEGILARYADDAMIMPPGEPIVSGKAAIARRLTDQFKQFTVKSVDGRISDVVVGGDLAVETGTYTMSLVLTDGTPISEQGKYLHVWRRSSDGQWKVIRYMSSPDTAK